MPKKTKRNRRSCCGRPKRLLILKKSKAMKRWLVRNPWVRPMCVFNYAAIKIQQHVRGFILRRRKRRQQMQLAGNSSKKKVAKKQLNRYLSFMDNCRKGLSRKPRWLDEGYSSWCAVRIQSLFRMHRVFKKRKFAKRLINQVATIIIQTGWRNHLYRSRIAGLNDLKQPVILDVFVAAQMIQLCWRQFCNKRIYHYFRDLIMKTLKGAPYELLRSIIPNESHLLDRASGVHARFRLGGRVFPPKVYFKIYTHRPLCDVNSFAPRNYVNERPPDPAQVLNRSSTIAPKPNHAQAIRVGARYFGAVVSTTSSNGTSDWYRRDENNDWRPIASHVFDNVQAPPWYRESPHTNPARPFHFSKLKREEDLRRARKMRRRKWMVKAYMFATAAAASTSSKQHDDHINDAKEADWADRESVNASPGYGNTPNSFRYADSKHETAKNIIAGYYNQAGSASRNLDNSADAKYPSSGSRDSRDLRASAADFKRSFADSEADTKSTSTGSLLSRRQLGSGGSGLLEYKSVVGNGITNSNNNNTQDILRQNYSQSNTAGRAVSAYLINNGGKAGIAAPRAAAISPGKGRTSAVDLTENYVDLVDWSMALNFDEYAKGWGQIGTSMPSDAKDCRDK